MGFRARTVVEVIRLHRPDSSPELMTGDALVHISVTVTNTGVCAGDEVVQCYASDLSAFTG